MGTLGHRIFASWLLFGTAIGATAQEYIDGPWVRNHDTDRVDDSKICIVQIEGASAPHPWFHFSKSGLVIAIVDENYPGREETFRVDKNDAISGVGGLSGKAAEKLIQQIKAGGKTLLIRSIAWPSGAPKVREMELEGILEPLEGCQQYVTK